MSGSSLWSSHLLDDPDEVFEIDDRRLAERIASFDVEEALEYWKALLSLSGDATSINPLVEEVAPGTHALFFGALNLYYELDYEARRVTMIHIEPVADPD